MVEHEQPETDHVNNDPLWQRIEAYQFDPAGHQGAFERKLARETGCSLEAARLAVVEYRRFVYLCVTGSKMCSPSELVDRVWHQHMVDTQSYWQEFCPKVLGRPLHHEPARDGAGIADRERFVQAYERTLARYREVFGEEPDAQIWPDANERFGPARFESIDRQRYWVVPRGPVENAVKSGFLVGWVGLVMGCQAAASLSGMTGPNYVLFHVVATALLMAGTYFYWRLIRGRAGMVDMPNGRFARAYLAGGAMHALQAAALSIDQTKAPGLKKLVGTLPEPSVNVNEAEPDEQQKAVLSLPLVRAVIRNHYAASFEELHDKCQPELDEIRASLVKKGLLVSSMFWVKTGQVLPIVLMLLLMACGGYRVVLGIQSGNPFSLTIAALVVNTIMIAIYWYVLGPWCWRTQTGHRAISKLWYNKQVALTEFKRQDAPNPKSLAAVYSLYGMMALSGTVFYPAQYQALAGVSHVSEEDINAGIRHQTPGNQGSVAGCGGGAGCGSTGGGSSGGGGCGGGCGGG